MIEVHDLTVTYDGRDVLRKVTLTVPDGGAHRAHGPVRLRQDDAAARARRAAARRTAAPCACRPGAWPASFRSRGCCRGARRRKTSTPCSPTGRRPCRRRCAWLERLELGAMRATSTPRRSPAACSSAWPSRGRWRMTRRCCCSTSRFAGWMRRCARASLALHRGRGEGQDPRARHARRGRRRRARLHGVCICRRCVPARPLSRRRVRLFKPSPQGEGDARPVPPQGTGHKNSAPHHFDAGRSFFC